MPGQLADPTKHVALIRPPAWIALIADRTGGTLNAIRRLEEMGRLYALVAADLRTLYTIEYEPVSLKKDGKWRTIKVEVSEPNLIARSRQGYFAR